LTQTSCLVCTRVSHNAAYGSHTKYIRMGSKATDNVSFDKTGENVLSGKMPEGA